MYNVQTNCKSNNSEKSMDDKIGKQVLNNIKNKLVLGKFLKRLQVGGIEQTTEQNTTLKLRHCLTEIIWGKENA